MTLKQMSRLGGKARAAKLSKAHRKSIARKGGMARARKLRDLETNGTLGTVPQPGAFGAQY